MGTVNYAYEPKDPVWVITGGSCPSAVRDGVVSYVRINVTGNDTVVPDVEIVYDVLLTGDNGTTKFVEVDVFATLSDATIEYQNRLTP